MPKTISSTQYEKKLGKKYEGHLSDWTIHWPVLPSGESPGPGSYQSSLDWVPLRILFGDFFGFNGFVGSFGFVGFVPKLTFDWVHCSVTKLKVKKNVFFPPEESSVVLDATWVEL